MKPYLETKDYSVTGESFKLLYDEELDMLVTDPRPKVLDKYYQSDAYISHTDSKKSLIDKLYQMVKKVSLQLKLRLISNYSKGKKTLLDVGAGTGDFLITAQKRSWQVSGIEPSVDARLRSREKKMELLSNLDEIKNKKFQVITLWHVLEHLPNFDDDIQKIKSLLNDDGTLVIAVPNFKSYDADYYREFWAAYDVPRHLWHFSEKSIEGVFTKHGMRLIKKSPMWFDAFYVSLLSEKYKTGNANFLRALFVGLKSNIVGFMTKEYSSVIYVLQKSSKGTF